MLFNSYIFFIFLGAVLSVFYLVKKKSLKLIWILLSSLLFYAYWDYRFLALLLFSIISDYFLGIQIFKSPKRKIKKRYLLLSFFINLGLLSLFKYYNFFIDSFSVVFGSLDYLHLNIILPVGISFYTFQTLSYAIDIYRGRLKPEYNFIRFAVFVSFFPQLLAGPIERAKNILPQLKESLSPSKAQIREGFHLIALGLFLKVMLGDTTGRMVDAVFYDLEAYAAFEILATFFLFNVQIYSDFAGYSIIARGLAKFFGINLMINFRQPYFSKNSTQFWRRWHISLSSWLKDYLYIPLGGARKGTRRQFINIFIVMFLGGLWHGARWNFVVWGSVHGLLLIFDKKYFHKISLPVKYLNVLVMYGITTITFVLFRIENYQQIQLIFSKFSKFSFGNYPSRYATIVVSFTLLLFLFDFSQRYHKSQVFLLKFKNQYFATGISIGLLFLSFIYMLIKTPLPFIYFQF